ncbi:TetR/AcrR family transcriptional regulator [uncultured Thiothrix sp.]|uniref:TetR/AcrR family transcriptional regulator n=1 Tax=uncultured Thiothrix sp. TaxID=223185 RepID=UPI00260E2F19|nr:TetR/AcrR family transcriptional regulator [uncultured Thiothrix sp.]
MQAAICLRFTPEAAKTVGLKIATAEEPFMSAPDEEKLLETKTGWKQNPEAVRMDIIKVATEEFALNGLSGARVNEIAAKTKTSKRMIYYYFGDKDGLYQQVLVEAYREVREGEGELDLEHLAPLAALKKLVEFTFDHHRRNPDFIRLVMIENIHHGDYMKHAPLIQALNQPVIERLERIYARGLEEKLFREGITALELHWQISALSFFNVSNQTTFSLSFGKRLFTKTGQAALKQQVVHMVLRFVLRPEWIEQSLETKIRA